MAKKSEKSCGCHKNIEVKVPTDVNKVRHKKLFPEKNNPFMGDI